MVILLPKNPLEVVGNDPPRLTTTVLFPLEGGLGGTKVPPFTFG